METSHSQTRSIGLDAIFQYTGSGVQFFSGMVFYIIVVRMFSTYEVGAIALFLAIVGLFNIIFSFGLGTASQHFTSYSLGKGDYSSAVKIFRTVIIYGFIVSIAGFVTLILLSPLISLLFLHSDRYANLVRLLSVVLVGNILFGILNGTLLGMQNFRLSAFINIVIWIFYYFGSISIAYLIHDLDSLIIGWAIGIFIGVVLELIFVMKILSFYPKGQKLSPSQHIFRYSFPVVLSGLIGYGAAYTDRFVVAGLLNLSFLGIYNFALLVSAAISLIAVPFNNILMPKFSELFARNQRQAIAKHFRAASTLLTSLYVPAAIGICVLSSSIMQLLGGMTYIGGALSLSIMVLFSALFVSSNILIQAVASVRRTSIFLYSSTASFASNIFFSYLLIPHYGLAGAAIGFSSVYVATFVILFYYARKEQVVSFDLSGIIKIWIAGIIMAIFVYVAIQVVGSSSILLPFYIVVGAVSYLFPARLLKIYKRENKDLVLSLFPEQYVKLRALISLLILH